MSVADHGYDLHFRAASKEIDYILTTSGVCKLQMSCVGNIYRWDSMNGGATVSLYGINDSAIAGKVSQAFAKVFFNDPTMRYLNIYVYPGAMDNTPRGFFTQKIPFMTFQLEKNYD